MSSWPHLASPPIVEGLIDIRVEPIGDTSVDRLKAAADTLAPEYPSRHELRRFSGQFNLGLEASASIDIQENSTVGFGMQSADELWVTQLRLDGLTVSRARPYTSWQDLRTTAERLWSIFHSNTQYSKISRLAVRFVNSIPLPPGERIDRTLKLALLWPQPLPQSVAEFLVRVVVPFEEQQCIALTTLSTQNGSSTCVLDIDVFSERTNGFAEDEMWNVLDQLRDVKNRIFFESMTARAIEEFT